MQIFNLIFEIDKDVLKGIYKEILSFSVFVTIAVLSRFQDIF
jgi:hypothetical protein